MQKVMIVGATSAIAQAMGRLMAPRGGCFCLLGRDPEKLEDVAADLKVRGAESVHCVVMDVNHYRRHSKIVKDVAERLGGIDVAILAHGTLPDQEACEADFDRAYEEIMTNGISMVSLMSHLGNLMEAQRYGTLVLLSSVAADRGRRSNYVYGSAKVLATSFAQGLRCRLASKGVHVLTVKPGFVDTPMTASFTKGFLWVPPERVARDIVRAIQRRKDVIYTPWFWRPIMGIIRWIPEKVFKKLPL